MMGMCKILCIGMCLLAYLALGYNGYVYNFVCWRVFAGIPGTGVQQVWVKFCVLACVCWHTWHWGTVNAAVKAPSAENPELSAVLCLKPEIE